MAKGHRLLKKVKSERAKVKLKGAKHLPKGTNVTDTSFKVKQIVIREQLKVSDDSEPLSTRKLNIKELISRLHHYNSSVRIDALTGLKELVTRYTDDVLHDNLPLLIQNVSQLVLDKEKSVRRDALKLLAVILSPVSVEKISPFFDVPCSYLRCAMTHIDPNIQEDSLLLLDVLLASAPSLVASNSSKILPNFFDLISKLGSDSKPTRTLSVSLGNRIISVKWRVKVLNRLYGILNAIVTEKMLENMNKNKSESSISQVVNYDDTVRNYAPIHRIDYLKPVALKLSEEKEISENDSDVVSYIDVLVPLLFDTWLEVGPASRSDDSNLDSILTEEACSVLSCLLNIFLLLWKLMVAYESDSTNKELQDKFVSRYNKQFCNHVLKLFPYTRTAVRKRKRNDSELTVVDVSCTNENLIICYMFCKFNPKILYDFQTEYVKKIGKYVLNCLLHKNMQQNNSTQTLLMILRALLIDVSKTWAVANIDTSKILEAAIRYYDNERLSENAKCQLLNILCEIVHQPHLNKTPCFQIWLSKLPNLLLELEISETVVDIICLLTKQKNTLLMMAIVEKLAQIIQNIPKLKITNCDDKHNVFNKIIGMFYWLPIFDKKNLDILNSSVKQLDDDRIRNYYKNLLKFRYDMKNEPIVFEYYCNVV